jgi:hypothetical protein
MDLKATLKDAVTITDSVKKATRINYPPPPPLCCVSIFIFVPVKQVN